jgi:hypothetical protein
VQRNWAQDQLPIANAWVFHIDSDERVTPELQAALRDFFPAGLDQAPNINGLLVTRRTVFMGRWIKHGGHYPVYHQRIFRRDKGRCEDRLYDQHFAVSGQVRKINGDLIDTITTSLDSWSIRHIRWAGLEAQERDALKPANSPAHVKESLSGTPIEQRRWMRNSLYYRFPLFWRALAYFLYRYFLRLGFLDGTQGLIFHFLQGFWFRFYVDAKLWEMHYYSAQPPKELPIHE